MNWLFSKGRYVALPNFEMIATGQVRAVLNHVDFTYYVEELWSDNSWKKIDGLKFKDVPQAKEWFERAKKARFAEPARLGSWHD